MQLFRKDIQQKAAGTIVDVLTVDAQDFGSNIRVRHIAAWDDTTAPSTYQEIGLGDAYNKLVLARTKTGVAAGVPTVFDQDFILGKDEKIYAAFNTATASDILHLVVIGEVIECSEVS